MIELQSICGAYKVRATYTADHYGMHFMLTDPAGTRERRGICNPRDGAEHLEQAAAHYLWQLQPKPEPYKAPPLPRWALYKSLMLSAYIARRLMPMADPRWAQLTKDIAWLQGLLAKHGSEDMAECHMLHCQQEVIRQFPMSEDDVTTLCSAQDQQPEL